MNIFNDSLEEDAFINKYFINKLIDFIKYISVNSKPLICKNFYDMGKESIIMIKEAYLKSIFSQQSYCIPNPFKYSESLILHIIADSEHDKNFRYSNSLNLLNKYKLRFKLFPLDELSITKSNYKRGLSTCGFSDTDANTIYTIVFIRQTLNHITSFSDISIAFEKSLIESRKLYNKFFDQILGIYMVNKKQKNGLRTLIYGQLKKIKANRRHRGRNKFGIKTRFSLNTALFMLYLRMNLYLSMYHKVNRHYIN
jgi:hypothetical protein